MKAKPFPTTIAEAIAADNAAWAKENKVKALPPPMVTEKRVLINAPPLTKDYKKKKVENIEFSHFVERAQEKRLQARPTNGFKSRAERPCNWGPDPKPPVTQPVVPTRPLRTWRGAATAFDQLQIVFGQVRVENPRR